MICLAVLFWELYLTYLWGLGRKWNGWSLLIAAQGTFLFPIAFLLTTNLLSLLSSVAFFIMVPVLLFISIRGSYWLEAQH